MATYAIGDIQGCFKEFQRLLELIGFDSKRDRLWLVGDLVNRGPDSVALLRFAKDLGDAAVTVLGNHDLHLIAVAEGCAKLKRGDTIQDILAAPDRDELLHWLRHQPLMYVEGRHALVHAGLLPSWSVAKAKALAGEVEAVLRSADYREFFANMYGNKPDYWSDDLRDFDRLRVITNAMTRLRICTAEGVMEFSHKGTVEKIPPGYIPWYDAPGRESRDATVICGHWSALGLLLREDLLALDTGCFWGGSLSAVRLEDREIFQVPCAAPPGSRRWQ